MWYKALMRDPIQKEQEDFLRLIESPECESTENSSSSVPSAPIDENLERLSTSSFQTAESKSHRLPIGGGKFSIKRACMWAGLGLMLVAYGITLRNLDPYDFAVLQVAIWLLGCAVELYVLSRRSKRRRLSARDPANTTPSKSLLEIRSFSQATASSLCFLCLLLIFWIALKLAIPQTVSVEILTTVRYTLLALFALLLIPLFRKRSR
ncbi:MAG: hypothetical protein K2Z81_15625 [Cyanobacteria bacterium]|nr:hypothetical protein [Cyanobacteriota bacterium]